MKKRELEERVKLEERIERLEDEIYHGGSDPIRDGILTRLEKLEGSVGEELPRLFTRIEELERVRIELEAGMAILSEGEPNEDKSSITPNIPTCQSEGDKARQPDSVEGRLRLAEDRATTLWDEVYNDAMGDLGMLTRLERAEAGLRKLEGDNRPFMATPDPDELERWRQEHTVDLSDKARQPETGPSDDIDEIIQSIQAESNDNFERAERAIAERNAAQDYTRTAEADLEQCYTTNTKLAAERDQARAERDRLREGIEAEAALLARATPRTLVPSPTAQARRLRALLDGEKEQT